MNTNAQEYQNPIIPGFHPDPSICRVNQDYYLVNSSFSYFPGIPIFHSKDLIHWKQIGYCLINDVQLPLKGASLSDGIWAPTIRYFNGLFYVVTTNMTTKGHFIVTATKPEGPWSAPIWLGKNGIDPSLFFDDDGKCYFTSNGLDDDQKSGIIQYEINPKTGEKLSKCKLIHPGVFDKSVEGPHLYKVEGYYYLMMAEGGTHVGHMETIARSKNPSGPYENCPYNPILTQKNNLFELIQATGHGDLVHDHVGKWWMVFLGIRNNWGLPVKHNIGRETFLAPVKWQNGWPIINENKVISQTMEANLLPQITRDSFVVRDNFSESKLSLPWNFIRNPDSINWSLQNKKGALSLLCKQSSPIFSSLYQPMFLGRRQEHFYSKFSSLLNFNPQKENEKAGLVILASEQFYIEFFVCKENGITKLKVRRKADDIDYIAYSQTILASPITLHIVSTPWTYEFWYQQKNQPMKFLYKAQSLFLTSEVAGGFVGNFYGMFATSGNYKSNTKAYFDWAEYVPNYKIK